MRLVFTKKKNHLRKQISKWLASGSCGGYTLYSEHICFHEEEDATAFQLLFPDKEPVPEDAGYSYCPYIPLMGDGKTLISFDFTKIKTRYDKN